MASLANDPTVQHLLATTPQLSGADRCEPLDLGHSIDRKFVLWQDGHPRFLVRLSPGTLVERRHREFELVGQHRRNGVRCPDVIAFGQVAEVCFGVFSYVPGEGADAVVPALSPARQYELGRACGRQLYLMHQVAPDDGGRDWPERRRKKHRAKVEEWASVGGEFYGQQKIAAYIAAHLDLLDSAPVRFQHDDFHLGNIIVRDGELAGVIDFNRCDWGDPIEDFFKVPKYSHPLSAAYACGQLAGYRAQGVGEDFWRRYNLYVAMNQYASALFGRADPPGGSAVWEGRMRRIVDTHDWADGGPPNWFREDWC